MQEFSDPTSVSEIPNRGYPYRWKLDPNRFRNALMHVALSVDQEEFEQRICQGHAYMEYPDGCKGFQTFQRVGFLCQG